MEYNFADQNQSILRKLQIFDQKIRKPDNTSKLTLKQYMHSVEKYWKFVDSSYFAN